MGFDTKTIRKKREVWLKDKYVWQFGMFKQTSAKPYVLPWELHKSYMVKFGTGKNLGTR